MDGWGGERQIGKTLEEIEQKHKDRYRFASQLCGNKKILDASCGCGYGSFFLSLIAKEILGVDISEEAIKFADAYWGNSNVIYKKFDLCCSSYKELGKFDVIVTFETIEHLKNPIDETLRKFTEILNDDGVLILSHPENESEPGGRFHYHFNIKGKEIRTMLEEMGYSIVADWMQSPRHSFYYHIIGGILKCNH